MINSITDHHYHHLHLNGEFPDKHGLASSPLVSSSTRSGRRPWGIISTDILGQDGLRVTQLTVSKH